MRVDLGRRDIDMAQKILHGPDVRAIFQKVRGERVAQRMRRHPFVKPGLKYRGNNAASAVFR